MTEVEQQNNTETVEKKEDEAPALPTTEPPKEGEEEKKEDKKEEKKKEEKEPEPPKDPREDPVGWLAQQIPQAVHIVNYNVLDWLQKFAVEDEAQQQPLPGKNGAVTRNQFLGFLRDGTLLAKLANKLTPGAIEKIHEGEEAKVKENQTANVEAFVNWAKTNLGIPEDKVFSANDLLEKGKAGYSKVFESVWTAGIQATSKFNAATGIDVEAVATAASQAVKSNILQNILNFFKRARPTPQLEKQAAREAEEKEKEEKKKEETAEKVEEVVEESCQKIDTTPSTAAVSAN